MLIHHLTIIRHKHLFVSPEKAYWIDVGLNPRDAPSLDLHGVVAVTLNVERLGLYHQCLYEENDEIALSSFLYDAWLNNELLGGLPDWLCIDRQLLTDYPLQQALNQIDPTGQIIQISRHPGVNFGSSKTQAQKKTREAIEHDFDPYCRDKYNKYASRHPPKTVRDVLQLLNAKFARKQIYDFKNFSSLRTPTQQQSLAEHKKRQPIRPPEDPPTPVMRRFNQPWVRKSADSVPLIANDQNVYVSQGSEKWVAMLKIDYDEQPEPKNDVPDFAFHRSPGYRWIKELDGIGAAIHALPYPLVYCSRNNLLYLHGLKRLASPLDFAQYLLSLCVPNVPGRLSIS